MIIKTTPYALQAEDNVIINEITKGEVKMNKRIIPAIVSLSIMISIGVMAIHCVAEAGYRDEYKAMFPPRVTVTTTQDESGKIVTKEEYRLFDHNNGISGISLVFNKSNDYQYTCIRYRYHGRALKLYEGLTWGDGTNVHNLPLLFKPYPEIEKNGFVTETMSAEIDPTVFKNAVIVSAYSHQYGRETILSSTASYWPAWKAALEDAEKLIQDK